MATVTKAPFQLLGADGGPLRGSVRTSAPEEPRPAVVICHGFKGFKDWGFFPHVAHRIAQAGCTAVTFNFSGSGVGVDGETFSEPDRFAHNTFSRELGDLDTVWRALHAGQLIGGLVRPTVTGLFGHSRGGGVAVLFAGAQRDLPVRALVTWAAIAEPRWTVAMLRQWERKGVADVENARTGQVLPLYRDVIDDLESNRERLDIVQSAGRVTSPWLIVHGDSDETVPSSHAQRLYASALPGTELRLLPGAGHTFGARHPWAGSTAELDAALNASIAWFVSHLM